MRKEYLKEIQANFSKASYEAYSKIRSNYLLDLHCKYDQLREEICHCITSGLFQASITLTNHLLELLLKDSLIFKHANINTLNDFELNMQQIEEAINLYDDMKLEKTINHSRQQGIISRDEGKKLHSFQKAFRNPYNHAEKKKLFGDELIPIGFTKLDGSEPLKLYHVKAQNFL